MTSLIPEYHHGVQFDEDARNDALDLMGRVLRHYEDGTTDLAATQRLEPVAGYLDRDLWARELREVFHRIPIPVGVSAELPEPGSYKAVRVAGRSLLLTRAADRGLRAMINVCRHRGMQLVPDGCGSARRFTCLYHAWSYAPDGSLVGVNAEESFGPVDRDSFGLKQLACAERAGIMFVCLTPGLPMDIDGWLGDVGPELERLDLASMYAFSTKSLAGPNWKVTADGYLESYHFASLHRDSVYKTNLSNVAAFDSYGPHMRNTFGLRTIADAVGRPREERDPVASLGVTYRLFPGLAIAGGWRHQTAVSIMLPGDTWESSMTQQTMLLRRAPIDEAERAAAQTASDWFYTVFEEEDYSAQTQVQQGLSSLADESFVIGRNEPGVQHFHQTLDSLMERGAPHA